MRLLFFCISFLLMMPLTQARPKAGRYRGVLVLDAAKNTVLPFNFELLYKGRRPQIIIRNADERITVTEIKVKGDSVNFRMPVFDTEFRTKVTKEGLEGVWINHYRKNERIIPFKAVHGESKRFLQEAATGLNIEGRWRCLFSPGLTNATPAVAVLHHIEQTAHISATFLTETGDYRFLEGLVSQDSLMLSTFDGSHAYLFTAQVRGDSLVNGMFYSGAHWQEHWHARRDADFRLRNADSITTMKDSASAIGFSFRNTRGKVISLSDKKYRNKPVIIQLMGSWCPNCMDESRYLVELYRRHRSSGLEIVALAFEKTTDEKKSMAQVKRMKERLEIPYEVLVTNASGKDAAAKMFPGLNNITAFPTTLFLNRNHQVVKIHTGFSGPATGNAYDEFRASTDQLIKELLK